MGKHTLGIPMDKEAREKIDALGGTEELNKIAQALYPIVRINREQEDDLLMFAFTLRQLFKALGYRKLPKGEPPLLSDESIYMASGGNKEDVKYWDGFLVRRGAKGIAQAQRDSDIKWMK